MDRLGSVFVSALRLGLTSFGGPTAHIAFFRDEYVVRRRWLDDHAFADLLALCQSLPGPASSQLGIAIGTLRAGPLGGVLAWLGFTAPSAIVLVAFALLAEGLDPSRAAWAHGLRLAAVAIVAQAVVAMWPALAPDGPRRLLAVAAAAVAMLLPGGVTQVAIIGTGLLVGAFLLRERVAIRGGGASGIPRSVGVASLGLFAGLLVALPIAAAATDSHPIDEIDAFYRTGSLVFGGGHVILPLLDEAVVDPGWIDRERFLAGYGAAQAIPGPLTTFAGFLGAAMEPEPNGIAGAALALGAIFLPSFLLVWGILPFWESIRTRPRLRRALDGANAAVLGILLAALNDPIARTTVENLADVSLVVAGLLVVGTRLAPPWAVVVGLALVAELVA